MKRAKQTSLKKVVAGALAVISLTTYALPADTGILSTRPTLTASATGTQNSIHVYGKMQNATGVTLKVAYYNQSDVNRGNAQTRIREFKNGELWNFDGDIVKIASPVKINFPTQWNQEIQLVEGTPRVEEITTCTETENGYEYTFTSDRGNTYQYENKKYGVNEVVFTSSSNYISNDANTHSLAGEEEKEPHDFADYSVRVLTYDANGTVPSNTFKQLSTKGLWRNNNQGTLNNTAYAEWEVVVPEGHTVNINYWVSCEENIDYLNMRVDNSEYVKDASNKDSGVISLNAGTHKVSAEYVHEKDPSGTVAQNSDYFLDSVYIQFTNHCEKCDYTDSKVFMQIDGFRDSESNKFAIQNGNLIPRTMTFANLGYQFWCQRTFSFYSKDRLEFENFNDSYTYVENVGNFTYQKNNYSFRYDFTVPHPEMGVFISAYRGYYDYDENPLFTARAKRGTPTNSQKLTTDDFIVTLNPNLSDEDAAKVKAIIDSPETAKWISITSFDQNTKENNSIYYCIYNPALSEFVDSDEYDSPIFSYLIEEFEKFELTDYDLVSPVDLILLDENGKAYPSNYVSVVTKDEDGNDSALTEGVDYEIVSAKEVTAAGEYTFTINGINNCTGSASKKLTIAAADALTFVPAKEVAHGSNGNIDYYADADGNCYLPVEGYENAYKKVDEADVIIAALLYEITDSDLVSTVDLILLNEEGKAYPADYVTVAVKDENGDELLLAEGESYEIVSDKEVTEAGEYTFTISGINSYTGSASITLNIAAADALTLVPAKEAAQGSNGNIEYFADANGGCYLPAAGYENAYVQVDAADVIIEALPVVEPAFKTQSLVLSGQIGVNFFLDLSVLTEAEKASSYMEFTVNDKTTTDAFDANFKNQSGAYYGFTCYVNSVQMADTITAVFHYGDSTVTRTYSVLDYINAIEDNAALFDAETLELIHSIADYGHYSQPMLSAANNWTIGTDHAEMSKYYTESYDLEAINAAVKDYERTAEIVEADIANITYSLSLDSETALNIFVAPQQSYDGNVEISIANLSADDYTITKQSDGRYKIVISNIAAHNLGKTFNISVTTANGETTYNVSALSYVYAVLNNASFDETAKYAVSSIYKFYEATMNYRNKA